MKKKYDPKKDIKIAMTKAAAYAVISRALYVWEQVHTCTEPIDENRACQHIRDLDDACVVLKL